eukprot:2722124-Amphidinium_carterae.1
MSVVHCIAIGAYIHQAVLAQKDTFSKQAKMLRVQQRVAPLVRRLPGLIRHSGDPKMLMRLQPASAASVLPPQFSRGSSGRGFSTFPVTFISHDGETSWEVQAKDGESLLEVAHNHDIEIEGACGGECACSTCH